MSARFRPFALLMPVLTLLILATTLFACGGDEEETAPAPQSPEATVVEPEGAGARMAASAAAVPEDSGFGLTSALQFMPAGAQVALSVPSIAALEEGLTPQLNRLAPPDAQLEDMLAELAGEAGQKIGAPDAQSLSDLAVAVGIDPAAPIAMFSDLTPLAEEAIRVAREQQRLAAESAAAESTPEDATADAADAADTVEDATDSPETAEEPSEAAEALETETETHEAGFEVEFDAQPSFVLVMTVKDEELAKRRIQEAVVADTSLASQEAEEMQADGVTIYSYDPAKFSYFIAGNKIVLGNKLPLVQEAAARVSNPQQFPYGSGEFPASGEGEIGIFFFGKRLTPLIESAQEAFAGIEGPQATMFTQQFESAHTVFASATADEPMFYGLSWTDTSVALNGRVNTTTFPGVIESAGTPTPLRLAQLLPSNTLAFITLQFTDAMKKQISEAYLSNAEGMSGDLAMGMSTGRQVLEMLKDEVTLGVAPVEGDLPAIILMARLAEPEATKGLMSMFVPTQVAETHQEVAIETIMFPTPIPLSMMMLEDIMVVSNQVDGLKKLIDTQKSGESTGLLAALDPPLSPETPRYFAFHLDSRLVSEILVPLAEMFGGMPPDSAPAVQRFSDEVKQIRAVSELRDGLAVTNIQVDFNGAPGSAPEVATPEVAAE